MKIFVIRQTAQLINCKHSYTYWSSFRNRFVDWGRHDEFDSRRSANRKIKEIGFGEAVEIV
jgi:hypothetical protein